MTKKIFCAILFMSNFIISYAQIGINQPSPAPSSVLDIHSNGKGILIPRMTQAQRLTINSPATGLLVFQNNNVPGYFYFNGTVWSRFNLTSSHLSDNDGNTELSTEKYVNDDKIRFTINGQERYVLENTTSNLFRVNIRSILKNVFIGQNAGKVNIGGSQNVILGDSSFYVGKSSFNTALGSRSMQALMTGDRNTAIGYRTLNSNISGNDNTAIGNYALSKSLQQNNTAIGLASMKNIVNGNDNTAIGSLSMSLATGGQQNTAIGNLALNGNTLGIQNTALGFQSLKSNSIGSRNTGFGSNTLIENTVGFNNTAFGYESLLNNINGDNNSGIGSHTLKNNQSGNDNTALGTFALQGIIVGNNNTAVGANSLSVGNNLAGNTAIGVNALRVGNNASNNTAFGYDALGNNTSGNNNTAVGYASLKANITGNANTGIGSFTDVLEDGLNNGTAIGYRAAIGDNNVVSLGSVAGENGATSNAFLAIGVNAPGTTNTINRFGYANGGFLMPRMTNAQRNAIPNPAEGLLIYSLTNHHFSFFNGNYWENMKDPVGFNNAKNGESFTWDSERVGVYPGYADRIINLSTNSKASIEQDGNESTFHVAPSGLEGMIIVKNNLRTQFKLHSVGSDIFFGRNSGENYLTGSSNTVFGSNAMAELRDGSENVAIGADAMKSNYYAEHSVAVGFEANDIYDSHRNNAIGSKALSSANHKFSSGIGFQSLGGIGDYCIGIGAYTRTNNEDQVALGARATVESTTLHKMVLGAIEGINGATHSTSVGIGTTAPDAMLHIKGSDHLIILEDSTNNNCKVRFKNNTSKYWDVKATMTTLAVSTKFEFKHDNSNIFTIDANGFALLTGTLTQNSDSRLKKNIMPLTNNLNKIQKLRGVTYFWKNKNSSNLLQYGLIAQELEKVYPDLVNTSNKYKSINYSGLSAVLVGAVNELKQKLLIQNQALAENDKMIEELEALLMTHEVSKKVSK